MASIAVIHRFPFSSSSSSSSSSHSIASSPNPNPPFRNHISRKPLVVNQIQNQGFRASSPTRFYGLSASNSINGTCFNDKGVSEIGVREKGFDHFRVSSVSDGGGGGGGMSGAGGGGFGDGNSGGRGDNGDGGDEDGGSNWSLLSWYLGLLEAFPVLTKAVTSAILNLIGDLTCQIFIEKASTVDLKRSFMFTFLGFALVGPTLHFWYLYLSKLVTVPGATGASLRLLLDQFIFSPIFVGVFLSTLVTLEGNPSQVVPKLQQEWFSAVVANWQLWIPFQFLNFRFVPQNFQVLAANVVALAWNVILSFKAHKQIVTK